MNECETQRCSQECTNIYGSYQCYCRQGYQLAEDGHTCTGTLLCPGAPLLRGTPPMCAPRDPLPGWDHIGYTKALASY